MEHEFSQRVLARIAEDRVTPVPRWKVMAGRVGYWLGVGVLLLIGAASASLIALAVMDADLEVLRELRLGPATFALARHLPQVWLILFMVCVALGAIVIRRGTHAYRLRLPLVAAAAALVLSVVGVSLHLTNVAKAIDEALVRRAPPFVRTWGGRRPFQVPPEDGVLTGRVRSVALPELRVAARSGEWRVVWLPQAMRVRVPSPGDWIVVRGHIAAPGEFFADDLHVRRLPPYGAGDANNPELQP